MKLSAVAVSAAAVGAIGLGAMTVPAMAGGAPTLPPVSPEDLVASVLTAKPPAFGGTVEVDNALGLPTLPGMAGSGASPLTQPVTTFRAWSDGQGRGRLSLPSDGGEKVLVADGKTLWRYDSATRTVVETPHGAKPSKGAEKHQEMADPAQAAKALVGAVRKSSTVTVDGTETVAGRPVYDLVLTPAPSERTLLREVRVAVDSATRVPLQLSVLADGSPDPALKIGFTDLNVGPQDPALFTFTPPEGVKVEKPKQGDRPDHQRGHQPGHQRGPGAGPKQHGGPGGAGAIRTVGDGWDTVVLGKLPAGALNEQNDKQGPQRRGEGQRGGGDPLSMVKQIGKPVSGPWGNGWVVQTAVGTALVTSDGRVAAGAVPQQVLTEALSK
jgi:outer membrane lipoprotein-sorting protein